MDIIQDLEQRNIIKDITNKEKFYKLEDKKVYIGFDPTGPSLHLGNYIQLKTLLRFREYGFEVFAILGGATGMIGDPSGKKNERKLLEKNILLKNKEAIKKQFLKFGIETIDNLVFYNKMSVLDFLKKVGKLINVGQMISREVVKSRIKVGISFTEFTYQLIQGWDFVSVYEKKKISVQVGGSDQWGNITTGIDMIKKIHGNQTNVVGITTNLLLNSVGEKYGKSEGNPIWLDSQLTSVYKLYQYLINQSDEDTMSLLKWLTNLTIKKITEIFIDHKETPYLKLPQKLLAKEVICDIHSTKEWESAVKITKLLYDGKNLLSVSGDELLTLDYALPKIEFKKINLVAALYEFKIVKSNREARDLIKSGSIKINGEKIQDVNFVIQKNNRFFNGKVTLLKKGKRFNYLVKH